MVSRSTIDTNLLDKNVLCFTKSSKILSKMYLIKKTPYSSNFTKILLWVSKRSHLKIRFKPQYVLSRLCWTMNYYWLSITSFSCS